MSLNSLAMLKCDSRTSLDAVLYKWQSGPVLMFYSYYYKKGLPRHFVLIFCRTAGLVLALACSLIFCQNQGFCSYKIVLI